MRTAVGVAPATSALVRAPAELLHPSRLDVIVKFLLFRALLGDGDAGARDLYLRHIARRTSGFEGWKRSPEEYLVSASELLDSLRSGGFDSTSPVLLGGRNGLPLDGAHRIAACLALGIGVPVEVAADEMGGAWDYEWFRGRDFPRHELDILVRTYARLSERLVAFIFWGATCAHWDEMRTLVAEDAAVVGWSDVHLDVDTLRVMVDDVYAWSRGPLTQARIREKTRSLAEAPASLRVVVAEAPPVVTDLEGFGTEVKRRLRAIAGRDEADFWCTAHATDTADEARYLVDIFFNANYRRLLPWRSAGEPRAQFLEWLDRYRLTLTEADIPLDDACIVGSAVLEAVGLRDATDIDCIVGNREPRFHSGVVVLGEGVDLVTRGYHRRRDQAPTFGDARVVSDPALHFWMRGLKFANPELVIDRKRQHARPKDLADVAAWDARRAAIPVRQATLARLVVWRPHSLDAESVAAVERDFEHRAEQGIELVMGGGPLVPPGFTVPCIPSPPAVDRLPPSCLLDVDPRATLTFFGVDPGAVLDASDAHWGRHIGPGHAWRRLLGLSWVARWMECWLRNLAPFAVDARADEPYAILLRDVARHLRISVTVGSPESAASRTGSHSTRDVCRRATEPLLVFAALDQACSEGRAPDVAADETPERLEECVRSLQSEVALLRAAAASHSNPTWIWGAGSGGAEAVRWMVAQYARLAGVVDSDPRRWGTRVEGLPVFSPATITSSPAGAPPRVIVASVHANAIHEQLRGLGLAPERITNFPC